jgi:hypothetical protein
MHYVLSHCFKKIKESVQASLKKSGDSSTDVIADHKPEFLSPCDILGSEVQEMIKLHKLISKSKIALNIVHSYK